MSYKKDEINVVYCCSDLFAEVCAVSLVSLFDNNIQLKKINVFVIDDDISANNKNRLLQIAKEYNRDVVFIALPDPSKFYNDKRFTIKTLGHTYARMILGDMLPKYVERIISLDSDTMILNSVYELWNWDMKDAPIAGVDDCMGKVALVKTQHLSEDSKHCNAGMYLIDISIWRNEDWTKKFYEYIKSCFDNGISLGGYEEEVITKVLGERMLILPPKFNLMTLEQVLSYEELLRFREPINYYTKEEIEEAKRNPVITHTTNFFYVRKRIFEENSDHPMRKQYEKYRLLTPWKNDIPMTANDSLKNKCMKEIWHLMPRNVSLKVANYVRNEIRPMFAKKRDDE